MIQKTCANCTQKLSESNGDMYCTLKGQLVERDEQCPEWERATGSDDE